MFTEEELATIAELAYNHLEAMLDMEENDDCDLDLATLPTSSFAIAKDAGDGGADLRWVQNCQSIIKRCRTKIWREGELNFKEAKKEEE